MQNLWTPWCWIFCLIQYDTPVKQRVFITLLYAFSCEQNPKTEKISEVIIYYHCLAENAYLLLTWEINSCKTKFILHGQDIHCTAGKWCGKWKTFQATFHVGGFIQDKTRPQFMFGTSERDSIDGDDKPQCRQSHTCWRNANKRCMLNEKQVSSGVSPNPLQANCFSCCALVHQKKTTCTTLDPLIPRPPTKFHYFSALMHNSCKPATGTLQPLLRTLLSWLKLC